MRNRRLSEKVCLAEQFISRLCLRLLLILSRINEELFNSFNLPANNTLTQHVDLYFLSTLTRDTSGSSSYATQQHLYDYRVGTYLANPSHSQILHRHASQQQSIRAHTIAMQATLDGFDKHMSKSWGKYCAKARGQTERGR
jgi:hypothetical protein